MEEKFGSRINSVDAKVQGLETTIKSSQETTNAALQAIMLKMGIASADKVQQ